jgi:hypothetical protein
MKTKLLFSGRHFSGVLMNVPNVAQVVCLLNLFQNEVGVIIKTFCFEYFQLNSLPLFATINSQAFG